MKILLAYKPTAEGRAALQAAIEQSRLQESRVVVARHVEFEGDAPIAEVDLRGGAAKDTSGQDVEKLRADLDAVAQEFRNAGIEADAVLLSHEQDTTRALLQLAESEQPDLFVIGLRRRSPVGKFLLGSVSRDILLQAPCPVLAVKSDED